MKHKISDNLISYLPFIIRRASLYLQDEFLAWCTFNLRQENYIPEK